MRSTFYTPEPAVGQPTGLPENPARKLAGSFNLRIIFFLLVHAPLAYAQEAMPLLATAHGLLVLLLGVRWALLGRTRQVLLTLCYVAGAEVLWRMTEARLFWEYGKYAIALIAFMGIIAEVRRMAPPRRLRALAPVLILVAAVPSIVLAVVDLDPSTAVDAISFNLSAYLALVLPALYVWGRPIDRKTALNMLLCLIAPVVGILFLAVYTTLTTIDFDRFINAASSLRSGGFGANQVSNMLGLGALVAVMLIVLLPRARAARVLLAGLMGLMLVQAMLTFSRGGVYSFVLGALVFGLHLVRTPVARGRFILLSALLIAMLITVIYPTLDDFTAGAVTTRYQETSTTGRLELAQADVQAFSESPVVGLGVGESLFYHEMVMGEPLAPHTEFTRLLAEHGLFGLIMIALMVWMMVKGYFGSPPGAGRAVVAALIIWSISVMFHSATRVAAIPLTLALTLAVWQLQPGAWRVDAWRFEEDEAAAEPSPALSLRKHS